MLTCVHAALGNTCSRHVGTLSLDAKACREACDSATLYSVWGMSLVIRTQCHIELLSGILLCNFWFIALLTISTEGMLNFRAYCKQMNAATVLIHCEHFLAILWNTLNTKSIFFCYSKHDNLQWYWHQAIYCTWLYSNFNPIWLSECQTCTVVMAFGYISQYNCSIGF